MTFKSIKPIEIPGNFIQMIGHDWMLVTAGDKDNFNMMTAAWGGIGFLWQQPMATIFIRPPRYTYRFVEEYDHFTLTFFGKDYRDVMKICGTKSGRDIDKVEAAGLTPLVTRSGNIYYEEASLVIECRKVYYDDIDPSLFLDKDIDRLYPAKDYHRMYIGFITGCLMKQ